MYKIKSLLIALFFATTVVNYGQYTDQINSNRPGETMSAYSVGKSVIQIETGFYGIRQNHSIQRFNSNGFGVDMMLRFGLFKEQIELIGDFQYQYEMVNPAKRYPTKSALKQTTLGAKYLIFDPFKNYESKIDIYSWKANHSFKWHQLLPAVSLFAGANINFANNPFYFSSNIGISPKLALITQNHFGDGSWVFVTNIIADYLTSKYPSYGYVATLTKGFNKKWSGFVENQGYISDFYSDAIVRGGAAFLVHDDLQIDASISSSLKTTPSIMYGGIGFSWRYDANYKAIRMKVNTGNSEEKKAKRTKRR